MIAAATLAAAAIVAHDSERDDFHDQYRDTEQEKAAVVGSLGVDPLANDPTKALDDFLHQVPKEFNAHAAVGRDAVRQVVQET